MTATATVQSQAYYAPAFAETAAGGTTVSTERKVDPTPRMPSEPNLSRQWGDPEPVDYTVYLPPKKKQSEPGPTYSDLNPTKIRKGASAPVPPSAK